MPSNAEFEDVRSRYLTMLDEARIEITDRERDSLEVADFGLGEVLTTGLGLITYVNNDRYCGKELMMLPHQTCPEHQHPPIRDRQGNLVDPGKRETFRCRSGSVYLFVEGEPSDSPGAMPPEADRAHYTVWHEVVLNPGEQYTIEPGIWHWFKAGKHGAIVSEFSSTSRDEADRFRNPKIQRTPVVEDR